MKLNSKAMWMMAVGGLGLASQLQAATINLNTGVNNDLSVRPDNSFEVRYSLSYLAVNSGTTTPLEIGPFNNGVSMLAMVADQSSSLFNYWVPDPVNAKWISPWTPGDPTEPFTSDPAGYYDYRMTVNSTSAGTLSLGVGFASDNT